MTRIKAFPDALGDQCIHPRLGKFDHQLAPDKQSEDFPMNLQGRFAESLPARWRGHTWMVEEFLNQRCKTF
jgi:hypothetical protein